jgi:hypothetical protein
MSTEETTGSLSDDVIGQESDVVRNVRMYVPLRLVSTVWNPARMLGGACTPSRARILDRIVSSACRMSEGLAPGGREKQREEKGREVWKELLDLVAVEFCLIANRLRSTYDSDTLTQ